MKKIIILGDSVTKFTTYDSEMHSHRSANNSRLRALSKLKYKIINLSRDGATVDTALPLLKKIRSILRGAYVIFGYGMCDAEYDWHGLAARPLGEHLPYNSLDYFCSEYTAALLFARDCGANVVISVPSIGINERFINWFSQKTDARRILSHPEVIKEKICEAEKYRDAVISIAQGLGVDLIDPFSVLEALGDENGLISEDGRHPTDRGYAIIEYELYRFFLNNKNKVAPSCGTNLINCRPAIIKAR